MSSLIEFSKQRPVLTSVILWVLSGLITLACFTFQNRTGPTQPLIGDFQTAVGTVHFTFLRSETIGTDLNIMLLQPVPEGITCQIRYRRFKSNDEWSVVSMQPGTFEFSRRGVTESVDGMGAGLPSLEERAGKYEYFVNIDDGIGEPVSVTGEKPIYARYKAGVPVWVLLLHIFIIFVSMMFAIRTVFETLIDGRYKWMLWATILLLLLGAFVLGPFVQWYAFGVWWSGVPLGYDWTDNKVLVELVFWLFALLMNWGGRRRRGPVYLAGIVTLVVFFVPHSLFGSEYDYRTGTGHGTAG
ncbi:MAG: hypothetical protein ABIA59_01455 [Candidatus Latescibacterota bacterium]